VQLKIVQPTLKKKAGVVCPHHTGTGCGIYETRPPVCGQFLCGWRLFEELGDSWRPDRNGVLIVARDPKDVPEQYRRHWYGLELVITTGEEAITLELADYIINKVADGYAVRMSACSPSTLLNDHLAAIAPRRDAAAAQAALLRLYRMVYAARWKRGPLALWHLYRLEVERQRAVIEKRLSNIS
jgi:hypothetical protein